MLGFSGSVAEGGWHWDYAPESLPPGQSMTPPAPLFSKLDEDVAEAELERLGQGAG